MRHDNRELWAAFIAITLITLGYLFVVISFGSVPAASEFFGHSLGILGFVLMVLTETLYTLRKRSRSARWGRMASWLQFHIFTGLVGPYLVLLHSSWKFNGLAGIVMLLTVIIVLSGFVGRYIYTAVPRSADGIEIEADELVRKVQDIDTRLQESLSSSPQAIQLVSRRLAATSAMGSATGIIFGRSIQEWRLALAWWNARRRMDPVTRRQAEILEGLLKRQRNVKRQLASLAMARRLLGVWHTIHIPIGLALFTSAIIHVLAALYYATLLH